MIAQDIQSSRQIWSAPLVPLAIAMTIGIVADRFCMVPLAASFSVAAICMLAWLIFANTSRHWLALAYLWGSVAALAGAYHHWQRYHVDANDIIHAATFDGKPMRLRGTLFSAPIAQAGQRDPLRTMPAKDTTRFALRVTHTQKPTTNVWSNVTGLVQVTAIGSIDDVTVGDEVEMLGLLALPDDAANPGGFDHASFLLDQGITATLTVKESNTVTLIRRGWPTSLFGWLAVVRGWAQRMLAQELGVQSDVAAALLLGEGSGMAGAEWEKYQRTGVIHVLAISGQHLVVLAGFLWFLARVVGMRRRQAAPMIALLLISYALLTGGRPPVMRAAWIVAAYAGGVLLQRPVWTANTFALGWIGVILMNPADIFSAGCQLSFLAVAVLIWGIGRWYDEQPSDPLERAIDEARSWPAQIAISCWRAIRAFYVINGVIWVIVSPLVTAHYHNVSPIALLIGPPVVLLTSIALLTGFAYLLLSWCFPLAWLFAALTQGSLYCCDGMVSIAQALPGAYFYVADTPAWWLWFFYVPLLVSLCTPWTWQHARWTIGIGIAWMLLLVVLHLSPHRPGEFCCTFVAVGHGGCTVIETPGGRVIVYDAGATTGPDVTRRHIAPFLWSRGIRRVDDLILSHADLDHFNGVPQLADRFAIGRVISTPTFAQRGLPGMQKTLSALETRGLDVQVVRRGQRWDADGVSFEVLHPPPVGPDGKENARSLVLLVQHGDWSLLLTGDLEEEGLTQTLELRPPRIDVLMAPHHGSDRSNLPELAAWARPKLVVSSQATPASERASVKMYENAGAKYLGTWPHGAITIRPDDVDAPVETYRTKLTLKPW